MAITNVWWDGGGYDLHLLPGESSNPLDQKLVIEQTKGAAVSTFFGNNLPADVTVSFRAEFKGAPPALGVKSIDAHGKITIDSPLPATRLNNFIVVAEAKETGGNTLSVHILVHIHASISRIWLTPRTLALYHGTTNQQLTVLAEFDDQTYGDITGRAGLTYHSSQTANVTAGADGRLTSVQANQTSDISVSLGPLPPAPSMTSTARVNTRPSLAQPHEIFRVRGRGPANFANRVNIVFLPDGFQDTEKLLFYQIVDKIVLSMQSNADTYPYNILKDSMNYWT